jgi:hypothetical protein
MTDAACSSESIRVTGGEIVDEVKRLIHEGNVRRVRIKQDDTVIAEFPLTIGVVGISLAPALAALGAIAALLADCTIEVDRIPATTSQAEPSGDKTPAALPQTA